MKPENDFVVATTARLSALIKKQQRLLEIVRGEKDRLIPANSGTISPERGLKSES